MNFLAHCVLGSEDPDLIVGGFLGDFVKGPVPDDMPTGVARGIRLHRRIDAYSNTQPDIRISVGRFPDALRRVAPVFVDVLADHFLARDFERFHHEPLEAFCTKTYAALDRHADWLPDSALRFRRMVEDTDLFTRYRELAVVERGIRRLAARLRVTTRAASAIETVHGDYEQLRNDFARFFPDLQRHAAEWVDAAR